VCVVAAAEPKPAGSGHHVARDICQFRGHLGGVAHARHPEIGGADKAQQADQIRHAINLSSRKYTVS